MLSKSTKVKMITLCLLLIMFITYVQERG